MNTLEIIRPRNIAQLTGLSKTTVWRLEKVGDFPKRVRLSPGAVGWRLSDVQAWLAGREVV